jgi:alpha-ketoglutarate-dependent taurine dioxygenase
MSDKCIITSSSTNNPLKINKAKVKKLFKENGLVIFKGFKFNFQNIKTFSSKFTKVFANDTDRREKTSKKEINSVDTGFEKMHLHSEASFSPSWPEILWFYCDTPPTKFGETTLCDGVELWNNLDSGLKNFLAENPLKFQLKIPINVYFKKRKEWQINEIGVSECYLKENFLYLNFTKFAINKTRDNKIAVCSHIISHGIEKKSTDPTILKTSLSNNKKIPLQIIKKIRRVAEKFTLYYKWNKNDFLMLDNQRFMHGRNKIIFNDKRKILNLQTLKTNF